MASYNSYLHDYAKLKGLIYENTDLPATAEQKYKVGKYAKTALQQLIEAEESRKITTIVQQQEEEFLKVVMKPSDMNMDFNLSGRDSIKSKRSSIFNIPQDRLLDDGVRSPSIDSLHDLVMASRKADSTSRPSPKRELSVERLDLLNGAVKMETPLPKPVPSVEVIQAVKQSEVSRPSQTKRTSVVREPLVKEPQPTPVKVEESPSVLDRQKVNLHVHYVGSLDKLANAAHNVDEFAIIPSKPPSVFLRSLIHNVPSSSLFPVASLFESPETRQEFNNDLVDDYDETELLELPSTFGPVRGRVRTSQLRESRAQSTENIIDYREIFSKCYRNARRKTRALLECEQVTVTLGDLADDRVAQITAEVPWEPLVQQWFAIGTDLQDGVLKEIDYENLIPLLFLGFEEIVLQAQKRGLIPQDSDIPRDTVEDSDDPSFNPLELLGVFLLRNNPRHNNAWEVDPYVHSFRTVVRQIRNEKNQEPTTGDLKDLGETFRLDATASLAPLSSERNKTKKRETYAKQSASTFLVDGVWDSQNNQEQQMSDESRQKLNTLVNLLRKSTVTPNLEEDFEGDLIYEIDMQFLKTFLLTFVEEVSCIPYQTKEAIRQVVRHLPDHVEEPTISEAGAAKILFRVIRMLRQTDLDPILNYCKLFIQQSEGNRNAKLRQARLYELFETMDETQTGYVSRPKVFILLDEIYQSGIHPLLQDPRKWPVTAIDQLESHSHEPSLPSGITPTLFDVDDYQSLLGDNIDTKLPIPEAVACLADRPAPQVEHAYVRHIFRQYPSSGSTGSIPIPEADWPDRSVPNAAEAIPNSGASLVGTGIAARVRESYAARCAVKRRFSNRPRKLRSIASAPFMEAVLNKLQFAAVVSLFMGEVAEDDSVTNILNSLQANYKESSDERIARLRQEQNVARNTRRVEDLERGFDALDGTGKGTVDLARLLDLWLFTTIPIKSDDVSEVLTAYGSASRAVTSSLTKEQFIDFCLVLLDVSNLDIDAGCKIIGDEFSKFFQVEQIEQSKATMRKAWLRDVRRGFANSAGDLSLLFKSVIQLIEKDGKIHSANKTLTASIALLEYNTVSPSKGRHLLRFVACSESESRFLLNKIYLADSHNIGFMVVNIGKPGIIQRVTQNDTSLPISSDRKQGADGSFICYPLLNQWGQSFGVLNVDTLNNRAFRDIETSEVDFHEAILRCLSEGFVRIHTQKKITQALSEGLCWFHRFLPTLVDIQVYFIELEDETKQSPALCKVLFTVGGGGAVIYPNPPLVRQGDPGFFDRLLTSALSAENVREIVYDERHLACPIRDTDMFSAVLLDINFGYFWPTSSTEIDAINLLAICQKTFDELQSSNNVSSPSSSILAIEKEFPELQHKFIFHRMLLLDLRQVCRRVESSTLSEIRTTSSATKIHQQVFKAVLTAFQPKMSEQGFFNDWRGCRDFVRLDLMDSIGQFDPTRNVNSQTTLTMMNAFRGLAQLTEEKVAENHTVFRFLYRWVAVCRELMECAEAARSGAALQTTMQAYLKPVPSAEIPVGAEAVVIRNKKGESRKRQAS